MNVYKRTHNNNNKKKLLNDERAIKRKKLPLKKSRMVRNQVMSECKQKFNGMWTNVWCVLAPTYTNMWMYAHCYRTWISNVKRSRLNNVRMLDVVACIDHCSIVLRVVNQVLCRLGILSLIHFIHIFVPLQRLCTGRIQFFTKPYITADCIKTLIFLTRCELRHKTEWIKNVWLCMKFNWMKRSAWDFLKIRFEHSTRLRYAMHKFCL